MISAVLNSADSVLRGRLGARHLARLAALVVLFGMFYGAVMGTFSATSWERSLQIVYAAVKVPLLLLATFLISLPSFFVLNTLVGLRRDFADAVAALISTQAALTIILASLAPMTALWYLSDSNYNRAILFNGVMFAVATFVAQWILRSHYQPLVARNPRHRWMLRLWAVLYSFVGIQMGWVLRPFVGSPEAATSFFREGAFSNAYVFVFQLIWGKLTR